MVKKASYLPTDSALFSEYMKDVKPLKLRSKKVLLLKKPQKVEISNESIKTVDLAPIKVGNSLDRKTLKRLKNGDFPISLRLDFHGCNLTEMSKKLDEVIPILYSEGKRFLLIITGKGKRDEGKFFTEFGVLRSSLPIILNGEKLSRYILAHCVAKQEDGGNGAFYVLLRANKNFNKLNTKDL